MKASIICCFLIFGIGGQVQTAEGVLARQAAVRRAMEERIRREERRDARSKQAIACGCGVCVTVCGALILTLLARALSPSGCI